VTSRDLQGNISIVTTLVPATRTADAIGSTVDLRKYESAAIEAIVGTITDGTHTLTVQESDDGSTWTDVAADDLQGSFLNLASNTDQEVGYLGSKRYIRVNVAVVGATSGGTYAVSIVRGHPHNAPI